MAETALEPSSTYMYAYSLRRLLLTFRGRQAERISCGEGIGGFSGEVSVSGWISEGRKVDIVKLGGCLNSEPVAVLAPDGGWDEWTMVRSRKVAE